MFRKVKPIVSQLKGIDGYLGITIEEKVRRIVEKKEPIKDGAPIIYTERKDGVQPSFNIRTDRFEVAVDAMDAVNRSKIAKRAEAAKVVPMNKETKDVAGGESIQGTGVEPK